MGNTWWKPSLMPDCETCRGRKATHAVGITDLFLVCAPCLSWGQLRRWWHKQPVQVI